MEKKQPLDFVLEAINKTTGEYKSNVVFSNNTLENVGLCLRRPRNSRAIAYLDLPESTIKILCKKSREKLIPESMFNNLFFCRAQSEIGERKISPSIIKLIEYLKINGLSTEGIFRREGEKSTYKRIIYELLRYDRLNKEEQFQGILDSQILMEVDFRKFKILELASALKFYIREVINGLFDFKLIEKIMKFILKNDHENVALHCKYLIYSLTRDQRECLMMLKDLFIKIAANKDKNKISWDSISNILSLTLCPQEAFKELRFVPVVVILFKSIMGIGMDELDNYEELLA